MDIISLQQANKAKKKLAALKKRLGDSPQGEHQTAHERINRLEEKDPKVDLNNRVSETEQHTAVNLNKTNLRIMGLIQKSKYDHYDMVVDSFEDDSGIDFNRSTNISHEAGRVFLTDPAAQGEMVLTREETESYPIELYLSETGTTINRGSRSADLPQEGIQLEEEAPGRYEKIKVYETSIIDTGENNDGLYKVEVEEDLPIGTSLSYKIAVSNDGLTFTDYEEMNQDLTIPSHLEGRYVKVRVELTGKEGNAEVESFTIGDPINYEDTDAFIFNQSVELKNVYNKKMNLDHEDINEDFVFYKEMNLESYNKIDKIEVKGVI